MADHTQHQMHGEHDHHHAPVPAVEASAKDPVCGMSVKPLPEHAAPTGAKVEYTCPMHPEIVRDVPGSFPICGMALEPRVPTLDAGPDPELVAMN